MKSSLLVLTLLGAVIAAQAQNQTCYTDRDCISAVDCSAGGDNPNCRCSWLTCQIRVGMCWGSCVTDDQCVQWSEDANCACSWWFECESATERQRPGYETYAKIMMAIKKDKIAERVAKITQHFKGQEDILNERLRLF